MVHNVEYMIRTAQYRMYYQVSNNHSMTSQLVLPSSNGDFEYDCDCDGDGDEYDHDHDFHSS